MCHLSRSKIAFGDNYFFVFARQHVQYIFGIYFLLLHDGQKHMKIGVLPNGQTQHMIGNGQTLGINGIGCDRGAALFV
jgi:hypothetical protein